MRVTPRRVLLFVILIHSFIGTIVLLRRITPDLGDFDRYWAIATTAGRPYVDYPVERAPGEVLTLTALAWAGGTRQAFGPLILLTNAVADAVILSALAWGWGLVAAACFGIEVLPVFDLLCARLDLLSMAAATLAVAAWQRDRRLLTAVALALGGAFKVWPLPFAVLLIVPAWPSARIRRGIAPAVTFAALAGAIALAWWLFAGFEGVRQVLTFRGAQGYQIESVIGSVLLLVGAGSVRDEMGADRIGLTSGPLAGVMLAAAAAIYLWALWKGARTGHLGAGWLAGVSALLLSSSLFSTQYMGWLVPGAAIAWAEGDRRPVLLTVLACALTTFEFSRYSALVQGDAFTALTVIARNIVVAAIVWSAASALKRAEVDGLEPGRHLRPVEGLET